MKFTVNTKPLIDALNLGVINNNISPFHKKSTIIQVSASRKELTLNIEAESIKTEIKLQGSSDGGEDSRIFVSSSLMKELVNTFEFATTDLEFAEGGLVLHSGKGKFNLPKLVDDSDVQLDKPNSGVDFSSGIDINKDEWKFIQDNQMYAIAMSFIHPVYTYMWISKDGDVLVGDYDNSLFTHSKKSKLGNTCLLSSTIVNLFESLPEGSKLIQNDKNYLISYESDSMSYLSEFIPKYEDEDDMGSYNSQIFLDMMSHKGQSLKVSATTMVKYLNQARLLSSNSDDTIDIHLENDILQLKDNNVNCKLGVEGESLIDDFHIEFKTELLRKVISNYEDEYINMMPVIQEEDVVGMLFWNDSLTTVIAGVD